MGGPGQSAAAERGRTYLLVLLGIGLGGALLLWLFSGSGARTRYVTERAGRGRIEATVTATGTVNPVRSVDVGTYVSGPILAIDADFNSRVSRGQRIAKIDPRTFEGKVARAEAEVANAKARVKRAEADLELKRVQLARQESLARKQVAAASELDVSRSEARQAEAALEVARAEVAQAAAALDETRVSLGYTDIISPVDGIVVSRNVNVGQTVAASFQTPTLFVIAEDLARMQVNAFVSEADIGRVQEGQRASFTVDAYPGRRFPATVRQVRNAPMTLENVVTYDVVLGVDNRDGRLKPGMTANVSVVVGEADDVLKVPTAALRFRPPAGAEGSGDAAAGRPPASPKADAGPSATGRLYRLEHGEPVEVEVEVGLADDASTAVTAPALAPGDRIITRIRPEAEPGSGFSFFGGPGRPR